MPIVIGPVFIFGLVLGWTICRKWTASKIKPQLVYLDRTFNSQVTRQVGKQIARIVGA